MIRFCCRILTGKNLNTIVRSVQVDVYIYIFFFLLIMNMKTRGYLVFTLFVFACA
jgi:hypothetical protein